MLPSVMLSLYYALYFSCQLLVQLCLNINGWIYISIVCQLSSVLETVRFTKTPVDRKIVHALVILPELINCPGDCGIGVRFQNMYTRTSVAPLPPLLTTHKYIELQALIQKRQIRVSRDMDAASMTSNLTLIGFVCIPLT